MRSIHPATCTALIVPFGAVSGYVGVVLACYAMKRGLTVEEGATLVASGLLPHTWKFLWAPVVDTTWSRRTWHLVSAVLCVLGMALLGAIPLGGGTLDVLRGVVFLLNLATTTLGMAVEGPMAHLSTPQEWGRVGGWFQAGSLGGAGTGGGLGLWLAHHLPEPWMAGAGLAALFAICALPIMYMGLVLASVAAKQGPRALLLGESAAGVLGVLAFAAAVVLAGRFRRMAPTSGGA
jgi:MFS family permease